MKKQTSSPSLLHDPLVNDRVRIESLGQWHILGADRRHPAYEGFFRRGDTPLQILFAPAPPGVDSVTGIPREALPSVSIITPSLATAGRFEIVIGNQPPIRKCCYKCVSELLQRRLGIRPPDHNEWIVYMLLECYSYMNGPAPKELPDA